MQCTSDVPLYYHSRDLNAGASGFAWSLSSDDANCGQERGHSVFNPPCIVDPCLGYHKEVLRQIIQNHEATFRYQVQELHRLYRRQNELMVQIRMAEIVAPHLQPQTSESNHFLFQAQSEVSQTRKLDATSWILGDHSDSKLSVLTSENIQQPSTFVAVNFPESGPLLKKDINDEVSVLSFKSRGHERRILNLDLSADAYHESEVEQFKDRNVSHTLEAQKASKSELGSGKTGDETSSYISSRKRSFLIDLNVPMQLEPIQSGVGVSGDAKAESATPKQSDVTNCERSSLAFNSSVAIDLNTVPQSCLTEDSEIENKFLKIKFFIDLNTRMVDDEPCLPFSSTNVGNNCIGETELEAPVSPENKEGSPPRGKSEKILGPPMELDRTAAESLLAISSSVVEKQLKYACMESSESSFSCLCWFADIASSTGEDLENKLIKLEDKTTDSAEGENSATLSLVSKEKGKRARSRSTRRGKLPKEHLPLTIKTGKKSSAKRGKCSMLSSDFVKKQKDRQSVLEGWGMTKKRQGGRSGSASKFDVADFM